MAVLKRTLLIEALTELFSEFLAGTSKLYSTIEAPFDESAKNTENHSEIQNRRTSEQELSLWNCLDSHCCFLPDAVRLQGNIVLSGAALLANWVTDRTVWRRLHQLEID